MKRVRESQDAGFTLVELLVVLSVTGLLTGLLAVGLRMSSREWLRLAAAEGERGQCNAVRDLVRKLLEKAYPALNDDGHGGVVADFAGRSTSLRFLAPLPERFGAGDIVRYSLTFAPDGTLHLAWRMDRNDSSDFPANRYTDQVIATNLTQSGFAYYGDDQQNDRRWQSDWADRRELPSLVAVRMLPCAADTGGNILVAPKITLSGCVNQATGRCTS